MDGKKRAGIIDPFARSLLVSSGMNVRIILFLFLFFCFLSWKAELLDIISRRLFNNNSIRSIYFYKEDMGVM